MTRADAPEAPDIIIERTLGAAVREHLARELDATNLRVNRLEAEVRAIRAGRLSPSTWAFTPSGRTRPIKGSGR